MVFTFQRKWEKARLFPTGLEWGSLRGMNPRIVPSLWVADPSAVNKLGSLWLCCALLAPIPRPLLCFLLFLQQSHQFSQARSLPLFSLSPKSSPPQRGFSYGLLIPLLSLANHYHVFIPPLKLSAFIYLLSVSPIRTEAPGRQELCLVFLCISIFNTVPGT